MAGRRHVDHLNCCDIRPASHGQIPARLFRGNKSTCGRSSPRSRRRACACDGSTPNANSANRTMKYLRYLCSTPFVGKKTRSLRQGSPRWNGTKSSRVANRVRCSQLAPLLARGVHEQKSGGFSDEIGCASSRLLPLRDSAGLLFAWNGHRFPPKPNFVSAVSGIRRRHASTLLFNCAGA